MNDFNQIFPKLILKNERSIKNLCAPLADCLGIPFFTYGRVEKDGRFINFANLPCLLEAYYDQKLYLHDQHLIHPLLVRPGILLIPTTFCPEYIQVFCNQGGIGKVLLITQCSEEFFEGFFFGIKSGPDCNDLKFFNNLDLLQNFITYFKHEASPIIERARTENFNAKEIRGEFFSKESTSPLAIKDPQVKRFLNLIMPLSPRERQCLELFKQGKTAQMTGAILGISQRTVESYFESMKNKLGCSTKSELLQW